MTGVCVCQPDPECPVHGLDLGVNVRRVKARDAGSCTFCDRGSHEVYEVRSSSHINGTTVRFCPSCWKELR